VRLLLLAAGTLPPVSAIGLVAAGAHPDVEAVQRLWACTAGLAWLLTLLLLVSRLLPLIKDPPAGEQVPRWALPPSGPRGPGQ